MAATNAVPVDSSNVEQLRAWDGDEGDVLGRPRRVLRPLGRRRTTSGCSPSPRSASATTCSMSAAGPVRPPGTRPAPRRPAPRSGVDLLVTHARLRPPPRRRGGRDQRDVRAGRRADPPPSTPAAFDVAISRTAAMFFGDHVAAFAQHRPGPALRADGCVLVTWQPLPGNEWIREISGALAAGRDLPAPPPDAPGPFALVRPRTAFAAVAHQRRLHRRRARRARPRACGSATTPTTPTGSCSA